jgi:hypothetical protein
MKCNETQGKWCKTKHGASKIIDTFETYQLPPPPPLPLHTPLLAAYEGQEVPPPPGVPRRQRDHPHGVVINPPPQTKLEVIVDLVSDNDE